jgi:hypothetical protein
MLGIARTDDEIEIRRAYARKLKAIDVDADPAGFIALRDALHSARAHAAQAQARHAAKSARSDDAPADVRAEPAPEAAEPPAPRPDWMLDVDAVQQLVHGNGTREAIFAEVGERTERIVGGPEMESIDHAARVERWAAELILTGIPRTNGMLAPAIRRFGWDLAVRQWACPPLIVAVVNRYSDCVFVANIAERQDGPGLAYRLLTDPGAPVKANRAESVEELLRAIRGRHPSAIHDLDPEAVRAWDAFIERRRQRPVARIIARWDAAAASVRKAWHWARRDRLRWIATLYLVPFVPGVLASIVSPATGAALLGMAGMWAAFLTWGLVVSFVRSIIFT